MPIVVEGQTLLTLKEAAKESGLTRYRITLLMDRGKLPFVQLGSQRRFIDRDVLNAFIKKALASRQSQKRVA